MKGRTPTRAMFWTHLETSSSPVPVSACIPTTVSHFILTTLLLSHSAPKNNKESAGNFVPKVSNFQVFLPRAAPAVQYVAGVRVAFSDRSTDCLSTRPGFVQNPPQAKASQQGGHGICMRKPDLHTRDRTGCRTTGRTKNRLELSTEYTTPDRAGYTARSQTMTR